MIVSVLVGIALLATLWLGYKYPRHAAVLLVFILPSYLIRIHIGDIPTTYLELSVWVIVGSILLSTSSRKHLIAYVRQLSPLILYLMGGFVAAAIISTLISPQFIVSLGILKGWIITPLVAGIIVGSHTRTKKEWETVLYSLIASGVGVAAFSLISPRTEDRLVGIYDVPNSLALFLAPLVGASVWQTFHTNEPKKKYLLVGASLIMGVTLLGTQSVGSILAVIVALGIGVVIYLPTKQRKKYFITILFLVVCSGLVVWQTGKIAYLLAPLHSPEKTNSVSVRAQLWSISTELVQEHPLFGIGLGQFEPKYQKKLHERFQKYESGIGNSPLPEFVFRDPHNWILSFWLNVGLLGLICFTALNILVMKKYSSVSNASFRLIVITTLIFGLVDTIYWKNDLAVMWWVVLLSSYSLGATGSAAGEVN